jgi:hypothetical protein
MPVGRLVRQIADKAQVREASLEGSQPLQGLTDCQRVCLLFCLVSAICIRNCPIMVHSYCAEELVLAGFSTYSSLTVSINDICWPFLGVWLTAGCCPSRCAHSGPGSDRTAWGYSLAATTSRAQSFSTTARVATSTSTKPTPWELVHRQGPAPQTLNRTAFAAGFVVQYQPAWHFEQWHAVRCPSVRSGWKPPGCMEKDQHLIGSA